MPSPFLLSSRARRLASITARIDACSALRGLSRDNAAIALYHELCDTRDLTVTPLEWRTLGVELGTCALRHEHGSDAHEFLRARSVNAHQRSDLATRLATIAGTVLA